MQKNKKIIFIIIGIVIIAIIALIVVKNTKKSAEQVDTQIDATEQVDETNTTTSTNKNINKTASISYEEALIKYKDRRIQLAQDCQATPTNVTYKNGTSIMVDNRSSITRTVKVGSNYTIKPWSFKIINLTSSTLPATWLVDCGAQQNVATILIQK